jgi:hypothetical protein
VLIGAEFVGIVEPIGPQGGGNSAHLCPDCVYALDHDDLVLVASDKPGHVSSLTAPCLFNSCLNSILHIDLAGGAPILGCLAHPGIFLQNKMTLFCH